MSSWESRIATTSEFKNGTSLNKPFAGFRKIGTGSAPLRLKKKSNRKFQMKTLILNEIFV